jgi:hypothetical protein
MDAATAAEIDLVDPDFRRLAIVERLARIRAALWTTTQRQVEEEIQ